MSQSDFTSRVTPTGTILTTTGLTTCFTAGEVYSNLIGVWLANISGAPVTATVGWYDADAGAGTTFYLCFQYPVSANGLFIPEPRGFGLDPDDEIRVTAGTANALHCIVLTAELAGRST